MNELYQTQILALARTARQGFSISEPTHSARLKNPLCGDEVQLNIRITDNQIQEISTKVQGCALCEAGAGLFITLGCEKQLYELDELHQQLAEFLKGDDENASLFAPFTPIREVKNRHKCVMLAFTASTNLKAI